MRAAVVTLCVTAVLMQCTSAVPTLSMWKSAPKQTGRRLQGTCDEVIADIGNCVSTFQTGSGDGGAIMANCCSKVNDLTACGEDVWMIVAQVLGRATPDNLDAISSTMSILNWCPRTGTSAEDCTAEQAAVTTCLESSGSDSSPPDCCADIQNQIPACLGQPTGSAADGDVFWTNLQATVSDFPSCYPFTEADCTAAASMLSTCYGVVSNPQNEMGITKCCQSNNYYKMFCMNQPLSVYGELLPADEGFLSTLNSECNRPGGGSGSVGNSGSSGSSGSVGNSDSSGSSGSSGPGYSCDFKRLAPEFQWYSTGESGYVVTRNVALAKFGEPSKYFDGDFEWYEVDNAKVPNLWKLQPMNPNCFSDRGV